MRTPGCVLGQNGQYFLPLVFVAHDKLYFGSQRCDTARDAIYAASQAIEFGSYHDWHSHEFKDIH